METFVWRKLASAKWADAWEERLRSLDPARLATVQRVGSTGLRFEYYCRDETEARTLVAHFGGEVKKLSQARWQSGGVTVPSKPLVFGRRLLLTGHETELATLRAAHPQRRVLCIPAALAFGSGEHSTTAMCLRLVGEIARRRQGESWEMLDLGTGSGVLALAARLLGAARATGTDYDPPCVRTARENARLNGLDRVGFRVEDVQRWEPERTWEVVAANLFSNLLVTQLPKIARAVVPDGDVILSGLLETQLAEVLQAARRAGLREEGVRRRGHWRALWLRPAGRRRGIRPRSGAPPAT
ncbi:MAG: 50S ribosomal protein L11 methyltransferase [Verrucomicrobia bacterium]|nr:50S ribosomal protein L11 methyltransferase [Verrucomicrobiota bacterium]